METGAILHVLGISCRPDQDRKVNRWYDERHIPDLLKFPDLRRVTRFSLLFPGQTSPGYAEVNYPQYLIIYEFGSQKAYEAYEASPQLAEGMKDYRQTWSDDPFERVWRVQYRVLRTWGERKPYEVLNLIANQCRPDQDEKFNRWYNEVHVPLLLRPGLVGRVTRLAAAFPGKISPGYPDIKYPQYLALYEFRTRQSYDAHEASPLVAEAARELQQTWGNDPYERRWRTQYRFTQEWTREK